MTESLRWKRAAWTPHPTWNLWSAYQSPDGEYSIWQGTRSDGRFIYRLRFPDGTYEDFRLLNEAKRRGRAHAEGY